MSMGYKVIHFFNDLQDFNHAYHVGDVYPRMGVRVSDARIAELASSKNKQGKPLIDWVGDKEKDFVVDGKVLGKVKEDVIEITDKETVKENQFTKTEINRMPIHELKALASVNGIEGWNDMTGAELKKTLIEKFNL